MMFMLEKQLALFYLSCSIFEPAKRLQVKSEFLYFLPSADRLLGEKGVL